MRITEIGRYLELKLAMRSNEAQVQWETLTTEEQTQATTVLSNYVYHNKPLPDGYVEPCSTFSEDTVLAGLEQEAQLAIGDDESGVFECQLPNCMETLFGRQQWEEIVDHQGWHYVIEKRVVRRAGDATIYDKVLRVFLPECSDECSDEEE